MGSGNQHVLFVCLSVRYAVVVHRRSQANRNITWRTRSAGYAGGKACVGIPSANGNRR